MPESPAFRRKKQCLGCPWKTESDPTNIPNGYSPKKHSELRRCTGHVMMACHESEVGKEYACVGWVVNQLGRGNNLHLRMRASAGDLGQASKFEVVGPQYETLDAMCASAREEKEYAEE